MLNHIASINMHSGSLVEGNGVIKRGLFVYSIKSDYLTLILISAEACMI